MSFAEHASESPRQTKETPEETHHRLRRELMQLAARLTGVGHDLDPQNQNGMPLDQALERMAEIVDRIDEKARQIAKTALSQAAELPNPIDRDV